VPADVVGHTYYGAHSVVHLRLRDGDRNALSARTFDVPQPGELVGIIVSGQVAVYPAAGGSVA